MNSSKTAKKWYPAGGAAGFVIVYIAAVLSGCQDKPPQSKGVLPLSNSLIVPARQDTVAPPADDESGQIAAVPEQAPLNTAIENNLSQWRTVRMRVTAYCPCPVCCGCLAAGITANGHVIRPGERFVAAPRKYSFGTEIIVPQYNNAQPIRVLDRGGAIHGNRLDLFFPSHSRAVKWGVKYLDVKVRTNQLGVGKCQSYVTKSMS